MLRPQKRPGKVKKPAKVISGSTPAKPAPPVAVVPPAPTPHPMADRVAGLLPTPDDKPPGKLALLQSFANVSENPECNVVRVMDIATGQADADRWPDVLISFAMRRADFSSFGGAVRIIIPIDDPIVDEAFILRALDHAEVFIRGKWAGVLRNPDGHSRSHYKDAVEDAARRDAKGIDESNPETWPRDRYDAAWKEYRSIASLKFMRQAAAEGTAIFAGLHPTSAQRDAVTMAQWGAKVLDTFKEDEGVADGE